MKKIITLLVSLLVLGFVIFLFCTYVFFGALFLTGVTVYLYLTIVLNMTNEYFHLRTSFKNPQTLNSLCEDTTKQYRICRIKKDKVLLILWGYNKEDGGECDLSIYGDYYNLVEVPIELRTKNTIFAVEKIDGQLYFHEVESTEVIDTNEELYKAQPKAYIIK